MGGSRPSAGGSLARYPGNGIPIVIVVNYHHRYHHQGHRCIVVIIIISFINVIGTIIIIFANGPALGVSWKQCRAALYLLVGYRSKGALRRPGMACVGWGML
jgi:hypothetical protein